MDYAKDLRAATVRRALRRAPQRRAVPNHQELSLLTHYVLGRLSLEQANEQLRTLGRVLRLS